MEEIIKQFTIYVSHVVEILAAIIIGMAAIKTFISYLSLFNTSGKIIILEEIRLKLGSSVAVSLELLLGADELATALRQRGMKPGNWR